MTVRQRAGMRLAVCVVALVGLGLVAGTQADAATPRAATTPEATQEIGQVTLFENVYPTGPVWRTFYTSCAVPRFATIQGQVRSFDNQPLAGCQVVLSKGVHSYILCAGRGTIPPDFQSSPLIRIHAGPSPVCMV
jgi:hypothetical protein